MAKQYILLGKKHGVFADDKGQQVEFHQIALDCGNYLKVFKVKNEQARALDNLEIGQYLTDADIVIADKLCVILKGVC